MTLLFADDPAEFFGNDSSLAHGLSHTQTDQLQLTALHDRLTRLRGKLPPLDVLAHAQSIDSISTVDQIAFLLFPHDFYKSYPQIWLQEGRFVEMTKWLSRLTSCDLSHVAERNYPAIDAWMDAIDLTTDVDVFHSSGTTGQMSFYPRGKQEIAIQKKHTRMILSEWTDPRRKYETTNIFSFIWPSYAAGRAAVLKITEIYREVFCATPQSFYPLVPTVMSADYQYYISRTNMLRTSGQVFAPVASPYVQSKLDEARMLQATHHQRTNQLLEKIADELGGRPILLTSGPINIHNLAKAGLAKGMENSFAPGSIVRFFGGMKGTPEIANMESDIKRFSGTNDVIAGFGMTELSAGLSMCSERRYHCPTWVIPFIFDPKSGATLPRQGKQKGRAGFFDLAARTYWGGIISADLIEMDWSPCRCGRTSPHMHEEVSRLSDDLPIGPASKAALDAARDVLTGGLVEATN